jgi:hypothetical protein
MGKYIYIWYFDSLHSSVLSPSPFLPPTDPLLGSPPFACDTCLLPLHHLWTSFLHYPPPTPIHLLCHFHCLSQLYAGRKQLTKATNTGVAFLNLGFINPYNSRPVSCLGIYMPYSNRKDQQLSSESQNNSRINEWLRMISNLPLEGLADIR